MRSIFAQGLCHLLLYFTTTVAGDLPPTVLITPLDWNPVTFRSQVAEFDVKLQHDMTLQPLLMLPPDDLNLCVFPASLENMTMLDARYLTMDRPIALLVARGGCPVDLKAIVITEIQKRLTPSLSYMIVHNTNSSQPDDLIYILSNTTLQAQDPVSSMFLSSTWNSGVGILEMVSNYSYQAGLSSRFLGEASRPWDLRVNLEVVHSNDDSGRGSTEPDQNDTSAILYYLRCVLFAFLGVAPCARAGYLWYSSGGRILLRRDDNGRVTGLQYIHPPPILSATGSDMHHDKHTATCLTEEQVQALPELVYKRKPMEEDDAHELSNDVDGADADPPINDEKSKPVNADKTDDDKIMENLERDQQEDYAEDMPHSQTVKEPSDTFLFTTCSMCSICLEEYEDGEAIGILPRCNHGFHLECIKPWLTERQSCCPLCKTDVLPNDARIPACDESRDSPV
ncbi:RING-like zinc finger [Fragilaria crotonensis]|nr:RING-like zinc finger [Fragilaria crotonensis]